MKTRVTTTADRRLAPVAGYAWMDAPPPPAEYRFRSPRMRFPPNHPDFGAQYYLRRCDRCSNFMNWLVLPDGQARCQNCGHLHAARSHTVSDQIREE